VKEKENNDAVTQKIATDLFIKNLRRIKSRTVFLSGAMVSQAGWKVKERMPPPLSPLPLGEGMRRKEAPPLSPLRRGRGC
jgi:hypothetical protein